MPEPTVVDDLSAARGPSLAETSEQLMGRTKPLLEQGSALTEQRAARREAGAAELETEARATSDLARQQEAERTAARPTKPDLTKPPSTAARAFLEPGTSVLGQVQTIMQGIGQLAMGIAGTKGRGYAIAATAALKGAAEGWQAGDAERVKRSLAEWQANHEHLMAQYQLERDAFNDLLTDQKLTMSERFAQMRMKAEILQQKDLADAARLENVDRTFNILKAGDDSAIAHEKNALDLIRYQQESGHRLVQERLAQANLEERIRANTAREQQAQENADLRRDLADEKKIKKAAADAKHDAQVEVMQTALNQMKSLLPDMDAKGLLQPKVGPVGAGKRALNTWLQSGDPTLSAWQQHAQTVVGFDRTIMNDLGRAQSAYAAGQEFVKHPPTREGAELVIQRFQELLDAERAGRAAGATPAAATPVRKPVLVGPDNKRYDGTGVDPKTLQPDWRLE